MKQSRLSLDLVAAVYWLTVWLNGKTIKQEWIDRWIDG